jgi:SAM-dependent methyltransferase
LSVSFDRAAAYYDATRSLPDALMDELVTRLVAELPRDSRCLEIGVGTGRIALPLTRRGIRIVGVDISAAMLGKLREKDPTLPVARADATRLPFADSTFGSAIASHVLHLIPAWKQALDELFRVVEPGGVLIASRGGRVRVEWQNAVRRRFFDEAGQQASSPGADRMDVVDAEMRRRGAGVREIEDVNAESTSTVAAVIDALEQGVFSACWSLDDQTRRRAASATRAWAAKELGDLDAPRPLRHSSDWRAYALGK